MILVPTVDVGKRFSQSLVRSGVPKGPSRTENSELLRCSVFNIWPGPSLQKCVGDFVV